MSGPRGPVSLFPLHGMGEVHPGDSLVEHILGSLRASQLQLQDGDVLVVTQKVVSKAENRLVDLDSIQPSPFAQEWADAWGADARQVEVVLRESRRIVRMDRGVIIAETRHGLVCANAGVDASNIAGGKVVSLLPLDPDASALALRVALRDATGTDVGIVISDTFGRAWREGQVNVAIGAAGVTVLDQFRGEVDPYGYEMRVTEIATADELASAAELVMGKVDKIAVVLIRGLPPVTSNSPENAAALVRLPERDMFR